MRIVTPLALTITALLTSGCMTHHNLAPVGDYNFTIEKRAIVQNAYIPSATGIDPFFTDGITTVTTSYKEWTDILILKIHQKLSPVPFEFSPDRSMKVSIKTISCGGSYVMDCTAAAVIELDDGYKDFIVSDRRNGYPLYSAVDKVLEEIASKIAGDVTKHLLN